MAELERKNWAGQPKGVYQIFQMVNHTISFVCQLNEFQTIQIAIYRLYSQQLSGKSTLIDR